MLELDSTTIESSELVEQTFKFWFTDNNHIRSPFPEYIRPKLQSIAKDKFFRWASQLDPKAKDELNDELNDEIVGERFEEFIFESAITLVKTEDEKLTINYPFLPRLADHIFENVKEQTGESKVMNRIIVQQDDATYMSLKLEKLDSKEKWETKIELPVPMN